MHVLFCFLNRRLTPFQLPVDEFAFLGFFFSFLGLSCSMSQMNWQKTKQHRGQWHGGYFGYVGDDDGGSRGSTPSSLCMSELFISQAEPRHPTNFGRFYPQSHFFSHHHPKLMTIGEGWKVDRPGYLNFFFAWGSLGLGVRGVRALWHADERATADPELKFLNVISCVFVPRYPGVVKQSKEWVHNVQTQGAARSCK